MKLRDINCPQVVKSAETLKIKFRNRNINAKIATKSLKCLKEKFNSINKKH